MGGFFDENITKTGANFTSIKYFFNGYIQFASAEPSCVWDGDWMVCDFFEKAEKKRVKYSKHEPVDSKTYPLKAHKLISAQPSLKKAS